MELIKPEDVKWRNVKIIKENTEGHPDTHPYLYRFDLPEPLASWDVFDYWEKERFASMAANLNKGDVLFDIGTEQGWCNLIYAQFVGAENMVLIEPTPEFWANIVQTWEKNYGVLPLGIYDGLFSDKTTDSRKLYGFDMHLWEKSRRTPQIDRNSYKYIHEHGDVIPQITIDDYVASSLIVPDALTMDTEGSELLILKGAEKTLKKHKPKIWVSIHPELGWRDYQVAAGDTIAYLESLGYHGEFLAEDHEQHWYFRPQEELIK